MVSYKLRNDISVTEEQIDHWNTHLSQLGSPQHILQWAIVTFPHLFQTTAFGLTGLATIDMLSKLDYENVIPLIFIDTLHHFPQTLDLLKIVEEKYYIPRGAKVNVFQPKDCHSEGEFAKVHGEMLWEKDDDKYDFLVKAEPASRAYKELGCTAVLTGRRRSQGSARAQLKFVEVDEINGIIKINPLMACTYEEVEKYINDNEVPVNELLQYGYRSIGDYHSTQPVEEGEDERSGRWKGKAKTECGIHQTSRFAKYLQTDSK